jgi:hypothetical protein
LTTLNYLPKFKLALKALKGLTEKTFVKVDELVNMVATIYMHKNIITQESKMFNVVFKGISHEKALNILYADKNYNIYR